MTNKTNKKEVNIFKQYKALIKAKSNKIKNLKLERDIKSTYAINKMFNMD